MKEMEGVWGNPAFYKKAGFPQILCFASLQSRAVRLSWPAAPFSLPDNPRVI
jgi:hypothetical protein